MKSSDLFVKCLEAEGVKYIFGLPGEENEELLYSLQNSSIKFITTRHEQGAAFMANVYGRLTGKAGVCLSTLGPGAMNLITGLADAHLDKSPMVAITAQGELSRTHKQAHQMIDVVEIFKPIVKWNCQIDTSLVIPESIRKAFKLSQMEKPGVTHLELPEDIAKLDTDKQPILPTTLRRAAPDEYSIDEAVEILKNSVRPIILAGNGAIRKRSSKNLRSFAESFNIPVVSSFMGKGAMPDSHPLSLHSIGLQVKDYPVLTFEKVDVIISIGFDIAELYPKTLELLNKSKDKKIIHIDFEPSEVYEYFSPNVEIVSDISESLRHLVKNMVHEGIQPYASYTDDIKKLIVEDHASYKLVDGNFTVPGLLNTLRGHMDADDILISDVGAHKMWIGRNWPTYKPGTVIISNGMASMGIALPGAIGAKLAKPNNRVVCINGDGGFMMNSQELETAKRLGLAFTVIIVNDNNYGLISMKQNLSKGKSFFTKLSNPDFVKYAQSFGINGFRPSTVMELEQVLEYCLNNGELNVIEVRLDGRENLELIQKLKENL